MLNENSLIISSDRSEVSIRIQPHDTEIKAIEITQLIGRSKLSDLIQIEQNIIRAADLINLATKEVALSPDNKPGQIKETTLLVAQRVDAKLEIAFSDDKMKAYAVIASSYGGQPIGFSELMITLSQHNLTQTLHDDGLDEFLESANATPPGTLSRYHIISGTPAIDGKDSIFEFLVETMEIRAKKPQQRSNGKVNMHELGDILTVKLGAPLIKRHQPTAGTAGLTVLGEKITPTPGQSIPFTLGEGTEISKDDENLLVASRVGIPRSIPDSLVIDDVLVIDNVDVGFGNVRFEGSVMISGDVCDGLKVVSEGSITVGDSVSSAILEAKGNITVQNGIIGKQGKSDQDGHSCKIIAGGDVNAKFIQYSEVSANDVVAQTHILHSNIASKTNVTVSTATGNKGTLFGGNITAGEKITAVEIGGNSGSRTNLTIVGVLPDLREQQTALGKTLQTEHGLLKQLLTAHEKVGQLEAGIKKKQLLQQLKRNVDKKIAIVVKIQADQKIVDANISDFLAKASINSLRQIQQGVLLEIDNKKMLTKQQYKTTSTRVSQGKIILAPVTHE
ncbi:MAG: DUF342 domain-containing protein [Gammaproteobacteria bacterium]|nr:DUF342 domain-containing protein [Gammaproteobacteria bacterium]